MLPKHIRSWVDNDRAWRRTGDRPRHVDYGGDREREASRMLASPTLGRLKGDGAIEGGSRSSVTMADAERGQDEHEQESQAYFRRES